MTGGKDAIADAVKNAQPGKRGRADSVSAAAPKHTSGLPADCPVVPLGVRDDQFYYLDANKQLRVLPASKHGRLELLAMFVPRSEVLEIHWPRYDKDGNPVGWRPEEVADALMVACARIGPVSIENKVRGPGAWLGGDGQLVMHCGDMIYSGEKGFLPGEINGHVYPAAPPTPAPQDKKADTAAGKELLALLQTWSWRRPDVDPHLLMGWLGAAILGGALQWRPLVWITGDKATGKSTLHDVINRILGEDGVIATADTTAAGIRQAVGHMTLPVAIDELEAEEDNRRAMDVIKIARFACSGAQALRGGADHKGARFVLRNCFLFSSILIPPMMSQDVSRMAVLHLDKLEATTPPALEPDHLQQIGGALRRRLMDRWGDFPAVLQAYRKMLTDAGHSGRTADQFGTLLACRELLVHDVMPDSDSLEEWAQQLQWSSLTEAEDDDADWQRCLNHLMQSPVEFFRNGERRSVGSWVMQAAGMDRGNPDAAEANRVLGSIGMRVKEHVYTDKPVKVLLVANAHQGLASLFRDTHWSGKSGTSGVWVQSMRRVPNAQAGDKPTRFDGVNTRYTMMPIAGLLDREETEGGNNVFVS